MENKEKRRESNRRYKETHKEKIKQKVQKWRQENREQYLESVRARYDERKIEKKVIGKETELNPEHVAVVKAHWFHKAEREALQYLYPKEVQYLWIKGEI